MHNQTVLYGKFYCQMERLSVEDFENPVSAECREITSKNRTMELFEF